MVLTVVGRYRDALQHRESSIYAHGLGGDDPGESPPEPLSAMLPFFAAESQNNSEILHQNSSRRLRVRLSEDKGSIRKPASRFREPGPVLRPILCLPSRCDVRW
jgi:hypothetical protein